MSLRAGVDPAPDRPSPEPVAADHTAPAPAPPEVVVADLVRRKPRSPDPEAESDDGDRQSASPPLPPEALELAMAGDLVMADASGAGTAAEGSPAAPTPPAADPAAPATSSGWLPEGFWTRAAGVVAIGAIAIATDDDDDDDNAPDADNRAPVITSNGGGSSAGITLAENTEAVTTVAATDADGDALTYSISGGNDAARFAIDASTGALTFVTPPNFESPVDTGGNNVYNLIVTVSDGTLIDTQSIAVTVTNADEEGNEAPIIASNGGGANATVEVAENTTAVTTVVATDIDADDTVTYSITGGADAEFFTINPESGVLRFLVPPDFEDAQDAGSNNTYVVRVQASDGTANDDQTLTVTVTNVPENLAPRITSDGGGDTASVAAAEGQVGVTTVTASDDNEGDALSFRISGGADAARFEIDSVTGVLEFLDAPDFENPGDADADNRYEVIVAVSDGTLEDAQAIEVEVTDVDEDNQAPVIDSGGGADTAQVEIAEGLTEVLAMMASDPDDDTLAFALDGGVDAALFAIDAVSGVLSFLEAPDFEMPADADADNVYEVVVAVSDGSASDTQAISVTVTEVAEAMAASAIDPAAGALFTAADPLA